MLQCTWQENDEYDAHAIDIKQEDGTVVGHVPREFSNTKHCKLFSLHTVILLHKYLILMNLQ